MAEENKIFDGNELVSMKATIDRSNIVTIDLFSNQLEELEIKNLTLHFAGDFNLIPLSKIPTKISNFNSKVRLYYYTISNQSLKSSSKILISVLFSHENHLNILQYSLFVKKINPRPQYSKIIDKLNSAGIKYLELKIPMIQLCQFPHEIIRKFQKSKDNAILRFCGFPAFHFANDSLIVMNLSPSNQNHIKTLFNPQEKFRNFFKLGFLIAECKDYVVLWEKTEIDRCINEINSLLQKIYPDISLISLIEISGQKILLQELESLQNKIIFKQIIKNGDEKCQV